MIKFKKSILYRFLFVIILLVIFIKPVLLLYNQRNTFFSRGYTSQFEALKKAYHSSQYIKKVNPSIIPDEALEAFIGGFLQKGGNPIMVTHDHPPLGRYLIAISITLFDNANTIIIPLLFFSGIGIFLIAQLVLKNTIYSLIPLAIFINEPLFLNKLIFSPLLEPIQLPFIIFSLFFFIKGILEKKYLKYFILTSTMLGFVISIRFFIVGAFLLLTMIVYLFQQNHFDKKTKLFFLTLPIALIILIISYIKTLQDGYSFRQVLGVQKYILFYHKSGFILPFSFWDLLLFNRWHTWWGNNSISSDFQWILAWPVFTFLTILSLLFGIFKKIRFNEAEEIILLWTIFYCLMLATGYSSTRYFLPLLPFLYILGVSFILKIIKTTMVKIINDIK